MKIIKLTGMNGSFFYVNAAQIASFYLLDEPATDTALFLIGNAVGFQVRDTPEEIEAMCERVTH